MLYFFGYTNTEPENPTGFFEFEKDEAMEKTYMGFRQQNEDMINWVSEMSEE